MAEGRKEFTQSVYVCVNVCVFFICSCVFKNGVRPITSSCMVGFENYLALMIIMARRCVACKNYVAKSKV